MKPMDNLEQSLANLPLQPRAGLAQRILTNASKSPAQAPAASPAAERKTFRTGIRIMHNKWVRYAAAAAIAIAVVGLLQWALPGRRDSGIAFAQVLQSIHAARNVTYTQAVEIPGGPTQTSQQMRMEPGLIRTSYTQGPGGSFEVIQIVDCSQGKQIQIHPSVRKAHVIRYLNAPRTASPTNPFESMLQMGEASGEPIGEKMIGDRLVRGFRIQQKNQDAEIWADPTSGLPVLVEIAVRAHKGNGYQFDTSKWTFRDFAWNQDLDKQLFSVEPPEGYEVEEREVDLAPANEKDLVETLRLWTDATGGEFPKMLNRSAIPTPGIGVKQGPSSVVSLGDEQYGVMSSASVSTIKGADEAQMKVVLDNRQKMERGLDFVGQIRKQGWRYLGGGVTRTDTDKPVCWWKPAGGETYRVIYGDLSIKDVPAEPLCRESSGAGDSGE